MNVHTLHMIHTFCLHLYIQLYVQSRIMDLPDVYICECVYLCECESTCMTGPYSSPLENVCLVVLPAVGPKDSDVNNKSVGRTVIKLCVLYSSSRLSVQCH